MEFDFEEAAANLVLQLDEVEMVGAMFPGPEELQLDVCSVADITAWLGRSPRVGPLPPLLDFSLTLSLAGRRVETLVTLPTEYPSTALPELYTRADLLDRQQQASLNTDLQRFLKTETIQSEPCLVAVVSWLQEHVPSYFAEPERVEDREDEAVPSRQFSRYWIYSHHIYSKVKRKNLLDLSAEFCLTGFALPGKPGVICVEGSTRNCVAWWTVVRHWNWKKINVKIQEDKETDNIDAERLFSSFEEVGVLKNTDRGNHMDMGEFLKYLETHESAWVFKELFGLDKS